jgi:hypothetical protein
MLLFLQFTHISDGLILLRYILLDFLQISGNPSEVVFIDISSLLGDGFGSYVELSYKSGNEYAEGYFPLHLPQ